MNHLLNKDNIYTWSTQFFQAIYNLGISTLLISLNRSTDSSIWLMFSVLSSFIFVLELGLTPTVQRFTSYLNAEINQEKKLQKFYEIIYNTNSLYIIISIVFLVFLIVFGEILLSNLYSLTDQKIYDDLSFTFFLIRS